MTKFMMRAAALAAFASVALALCVLSPASAQNSPDPYANPLSIEDPILCERSFFGRVTGGNAPYTLGFVLSPVQPPPATLDLGSFPLAAAGRFAAPAGFVTGVPDGTYNVTVTLTDDIGQVVTRSFVGTTTAACPRPPAGGGGSAIAGPSTALAVAAPAKPVPVAVVAAPVQPLAYTGSSIDLPVVIGFSMVGLGGLALLEARKRQSSTTSKR